MILDTKNPRRAPHPLHQSKHSNNTYRLPGVTQSLRVAHDKKNEVLRRVLIGNALSFPIVQQPAGNDRYISAVDGEITEFDTPSYYGNVGLLAHNYLSGKYFSEFTWGQSVRLIYGNGEIETFVVTEILQYQALQPTNPYSLFRAPNSAEVMTAARVFEKTYQGGRRVTFQTCIAFGGNSMWGRLFVIATPQVFPGFIPWN